MSQTQTAGDAIAPGAFQNRHRSVLDVTATIPAGTPIGVNGSQAGTSHRGSMSHDLGGGPSQFAESLGRSRWIYVNGVTASPVWESMGAFSLGITLHPGTTIHIDTWEEEVAPDWTATFANSRFSWASGGYGAFSSSSRYAAIWDIDSNGPTGSSFRIVGIDGSEVLFDEPTVGTMFDFMWRHEGDEFYWIDASNNLARYHVSGMLLQTIDLPDTLNGEAVQWRGVVHGGITSYTKGFTASDDWLLRFDETGVIGMPWTIRSLGRTEIRVGNLWQRGEFGFGMSLTGAEQARLWLTPPDGSQLVELTGGRTINLTAGPSFLAHTHSAFDHKLILVGWSDNVWEVWDVGDLGMPVLLHTITEQMMRDAVGHSPTLFHQINHADLRNGRAAVSIGYGTVPQTWAVAVWKANELLVVADGISHSPTELFPDQVRPGISPNGRYVIYHDGTATKIATVPASF